jgi:hypothetical protein
MSLLSCAAAETEIVRAVYITKQNRFIMFFD